MHAAQTLPFPDLGATSGNINAGGGNTPFGISNLEAPVLSTTTSSTKRGRGSSCERGFSARDDRRRRKQLRIEIPGTDSTHAHSRYSTPSSLFSAASLNSLFDDENQKPSSPDCLATPKSQCAHNNNNTATSAMSPTTPPATNGHDHRPPAPILRPALLPAPPIQGLYFNPSLKLPQDLADEVVEYCLGTYFQSPNVNQVMLFGRAMDPVVPSTGTDTSNKCTLFEDSSCRLASSVSPPFTNTAGLPTIFLSLLSTLSSLLKPFLPTKIHTLLFPPNPTQARQAIINLYAPGEGISPHIDLLNRYGDGIIGVSFGSGCVMQFVRDSDSDKPIPSPSEADRWDLYLPERSTLVLTEDARYHWTHGINRLTRDYVSVVGSSTNPAASGATEESGRWIERNVRTSVTFRWLLPGADVVGPSGSDA